MRPDVALAGEEAVDDYRDRERFLIDRLGVPRQWLAAAKAVLARARDRPRDRALHLIEVRLRGVSPRGAYFPLFADMSTP